MDALPSRWDVIRDETWNELQIIVMSCQAQVCSSHTCLRVAVDLLLTVLNDHIQRSDAVTSVRVVFNAEQWSGIIQLSFVDCSIGAPHQ